MAAVQIDCPSKDLFYKEAEGDDGERRETAQEWDGRGE